MQYMLTRLLAYSLSYEEISRSARWRLVDETCGRARSTQGARRVDRCQGALRGRLHKAAKAARRVSVFTHAPLARLRDEAAARPVHKVEDIAIWRFDPTFLDALEAKMSRNTVLGLARNDGQLYVDAGGSTLETTLRRELLVTGE